MVKKSYHLGLVWYFVVLYDLAINPWLGQEKGDWMRMHVVYLDEVSQVNLRILIEDTNEMNEMSMPLAILRRIMDT